MPRRQTRSSRPLVERLGSRNQRVVLLMIAGVLFESAGLWLRTRRVGGNLIVRCLRGHLFTTIWIPAASLKALRLGLWRAQYCPVGRHWTIVTPVRDRELSDDERRAAAEHHDFPIP